MLMPIFTEKTLGLAKTQNQYTFAVGAAETKNTIKLALIEAFGVNPMNVKVSNLAGKAKRRGKGRTLIWGSDLKKAIVKLPEKEKIDLFDTEEKKGKKAKKTETTK